MINIVESQLYLNERNMFSIVLVSFAKLKQIHPSELLYSFDKDEYSIRLYIEYEEGLIQFLHAFDKRYYQLSHYPKQGSRFHILTQDSLDKFMSELIQTKREKCILLA